jgi:hypothetical protein
VATRRTRASSLPTFVIPSSFDIRVSSFYRAESSELTQRQRMFVKSFNDPP